MTRPAPTFRLLTTDDAALFRALRARACSEEPGSFLMTGEEAEQQSDAQIRHMLSGSWVLGAFLGDTMVGMTGLQRNPNLKTRHKGMVWGVYVAPEARGLRCASKMIERLLDIAKQDGVEVVTLSTDVTNPITVELYKSLGFEPYGVEPHLLKLDDGSYIDDVWMVKYLEKP